MTSVERVLLSTVCQQERVSVRAGEMPQLRYLGMESIEAGTGQLAAGELSKTPEAPEANSFRFGTNHVLYGKLRPYLNKVIAPDFDGKCSTELVPLRPTECLDRRFLAYFLRAPATVEAISQKVAGARMPRADMAFVLSLPIPLPCLERQRQIVEFLSRAENIVRMRREAERKAREIIPALFLDMFGNPATNPKGWPKVLLGDAIEKFRYGSSQKSSGSGHPVLRIPNVVGGQINTRDLKFLDVEEVDRARYLLETGDVLFVRTNGNPDYVGRCAVFDPPDDRSWLFASYLIMGRPCTSVVHPTYLQAYLSSLVGRGALREQARTAAGQYNINIEGLRSIPLLLPPVSFQATFADRHKELSDFRNRQLLASELATETFQSLLTGAFERPE
jgi:type I restriction enzyme, S subunit